MKRVLLAFLLLPALGHAQTIESARVEATIDCANGRLVITTALYAPADRPLSVPPQAEPYHVNRGYMRVGVENLDTSKRYETAPIISDAGFGNKILPPGERMQWSTSLGDYFFKLSEDVARGGAFEVTWMHSLYAPDIHRLVATCQPRADGV